MKLFVFCLIYGVVCALIGGVILLLVDKCTTNITGYMSKYATKVLLGVGYSIAAVGGVSLIACVSDLLSVSMGNQLTVIPYESAWFYMLPFGAVAYTFIHFAIQQIK